MPGTHIEKGISQVSNEGVTYLPGGSGWPSLSFLGPESWKNQGCTARRTKQGMAGTGKKCPTPSCIRFDFEANPPVPSKA